ncbi:MAG: crossover junction endodeoxyribonuclease RuvC [Caldilineaceae bacterium]|nr:crossover junction endodeoxyribonuclease RuvC [Caldilineaceae bacterium]
MNQALPPEQIVLGVDPGTAITGYGAVRMTADNEMRLLACGVIRTAPSDPMHQRLLELHTDLTNLIREFKPHAMAVEKLFFGRNVTTAISVGQARGVILLTGAQAGLSIAEYTPAEIKQALTGYGNADKQQMQHMTAHLLGLDDIPRPDDAADGVAIALCHLQQARYQALLAE